MPGPARAARLAAALLAAAAAGMPAAAAGAPAPDVVVFLADDLGFSDVGSYGGEIDTRALDQLAADGVRLAEFYVTPRCSPTRAALLTGRHPHAAGVGHLADFATDHPAYRGRIRSDVPTLPERLREAGYRSYLAGKWHLAPGDDPAGPDAPLARGFERFFGVMRGADDSWHPTSLARDRQALPAPGDGFFLTDALAEAAGGFLADHARDTPERPFFLLVSFTAPHWPVQAPEPDVREHTGAYADGWGRVRAARALRVGELGLRIPPFRAPWDPAVPAWESVADPGWERARMRAYAGRVRRMDRAVDRVMQTLAVLGRADTTLVLFLSDNGASPETLPPWSGRLRRALGLWTPAHYGDAPGRAPGGPDTFQSAGRGWAHVQNAPFRGYKAQLLEGGIASPLVARWPAGGIAGGGAPVHGPAHVTDLAPTLLDLAGLPVPPEIDGASLLPLLRGEARTPAPLFWEHEGWGAVRDGDWKAVSPWPGPWPWGARRWELYDLASDPTETRDLAARHPGRTARLAARWEAWAREVGVQPWPWVLPAARRAAAAAAGLGLLVVLGGLALVRRYARARTPRRA